eukprot:4921177-Alexandrium_andersonii.AAC.1
MNARRTRALRQAPADRARVRQSQGCSKGASQRPRTSGELLGSHTRGANGPTWDPDGRTKRVGMPTSNPRSDARQQPTR